MALSLVSSAQPQAKPRRQRHKPMPRPSAAPQAAAADKAADKAADDAPDAPADNLAALLRMKIAVTVEDAAFLLSIGRPKAWELVMTGDIPSVTIGRSRRILVSSLLAFAQRLEAQQRRHE